ncbi:MAG: hypothetical protein HFJ04_10125 [Lachnospiraceae bacterium]|nr:hypothetical protein [Lachnospiraceae bacterium]
MKQITRCRLAEIMKTLTQDVTMTRRDFLLSVLAGILGGIVLGMLISPRKYMHIGCDNGNIYGLPEEEAEK